MQEQSFPPPMARQTDPDTSHAAAADATINASAGRLAALRVLYGYGPMTDFGLARHTGLQQTSIGKRRGECVTAGLVEAATERLEPARLFEGAATVPMSLAAAVVVIAAWTIVPLAVGAWRTCTRDA